MFVTAPDALLSAVAFGPGPNTVLALNGWSAAWQAWAPTFEYLSHDTRCISYDTRGTGGSTGSAASITLDVLADDAIRVLDAYGIERCVIAGESLGGFVAQHLVVRHPDRCTALALVASAPFVMADIIGWLVDGARTDYPATLERFVGLCLSEPDAAMLHHWGTTLFSTADPLVAARLFEACYDSIPDIASITVPTVVLHGDDDQVVPFAAGEYLAATIPGAEWIPLAGTGHAPTVTRPVEVADALRRLFDRT
jgi:pimeloyl-ACP methyl ester carboxylesterase